MLLKPRISLTTVGLAMTPFVIGLVVIAEGVAASASGCTTVSSASLPSPNGAFSAIVDQNHCEAGYAFTATSNFTVRVVSKATSKSDTVFSFDDNGNVNTRPTLKWIAAQALQITALSEAGVGSIEKTKSSTVTISYKFLRTQI